MEFYENLTATCLGGTGTCGSGIISDVTVASNLTDSATATATTNAYLRIGPDPEYADFRDSSRFWVKRVLFPLIVCIGVIGNGLTIVILTRRRMRSSTNHYLTALAFSDTFYLIFAFTLSLNDTHAATSTYIYYSYYRYGLMLTDACSNTSVWLTVTFTIERYVAVCHPIRGKVLCTRSRAKRVIVAVVCLCFLVVIPTPLEWRVVEELAADNVTIAKVYLEHSDLGANETYKDIYYWFTSVSFVFVPLTLLTIFNSFLIRSVHHSKTRRRRMTMRGKRGHDHAHQENRITVMLIAVVILFLLCQLPTAVVLVYTSIHTFHVKSNEYAAVLGVNNICNLLVAVNAACNFVLYCAFSDRYRRTFLRIFLPCMFRLASPAQSQTTLNTVYTQVDSDGTSLIKRGRNSVASGGGGSGSMRTTSMTSSSAAAAAAASLRRSANSASSAAATTRTSLINASRGPQADGKRNGSLQMLLLPNSECDAHPKAAAATAALPTSQPLQPFAHNGIYVRELRKDSDATNDSNLSVDEQTTPRVDALVSSNSNGVSSPPKGCERPLALVNVDDSILQT